MKAKKEARKMRADHATAEVFFTAFKTLRTKEKEAFLEKVISDSTLREDLIDIALMEEAKKAKGKSISAGEYFAKRRKTEKGCLSNYNVKLMP